MNNVKQVKISYFREIIVPAAASGAIAYGIMLLAIYLKTQKLSDASPTAGLVAFVVASLIATLRLNHRIYQLNLDQWQQLKQDRELVIQPRIKPFNAYTLDRVHELLIPEIRGCVLGEEGPCNLLLALDLGGPTSWWTNDMLGYLALQVNWVVRSPGRRVKRIFVWEPAEYISLPGIKIISIHKMLGFETYVFPKPCYRALMKKKEMRAKKQLFREFLVWDPGGAKSSKPLLHGGAEVWGYHSPRSLDETAAVEGAMTDDEGSLLISLLSVHAAAEDYGALFTTIVTYSDCVKIAAPSVGTMEQEIRNAVARWLK